MYRLNVEGLELRPELGEGAFSLDVAFDEVKDLVDVVAFLVFFVD